MSEHKIAIVANGCFWCTEAVFRRVKGVVSVVPGYTGGTSSHPTYAEVSTGTSGHVEAIKIEYDPSVISYQDILTVFFNTHDPTTYNRQGNDVGPQYRSVIFYGTEEEKVQAKAYIRELNDTHAYDNPVVTDVVPQAPFYEAEDYHHRYYEQHRDEMYCQLVIAPKLEKLQKRFAALLAS